MRTGEQEPRRREDDDREVELAQPGAQVVHEKSLVHDEVGHEHEPGEDADHDRYPIALLRDDHQQATAVRPATFTKAVANATPMMFPAAVWKPCAKVPYRLL